MQKLWMTSKEHFNHNTIKLILSITLCSDISENINNLNFIYRLILTKNYVLS